MLPHSVLHLYVRESVNIRELKNNPPMPSHGAVPAVVMNCDARSFAVPPDDEGLLGEPGVQSPYPSFPRRQSSVRSNAAVPRLRGDDARLNRGTDTRHKVTVR
jgi:hypothetical protein